MYTRKQIRENRLKFAKGLQEPHRERETNRLEHPNKPNMRCCLGHGCNIFDIERTVTNFESYNKVKYGAEYSDATAPKELIELLGLNDTCGGTKEPDDYLIKSQRYLTNLNDVLEMKPQEIGKLIEGWIEGGKGTPFIPLDSYPETLEE